MNREENQLHEEFIIVALEKCSAPAWPGGIEEEQS